MESKAGGSSPRTQNLDPEGVYTRARSRFGIVCFPVQVLLAVIQVALTVFVRDVYLVRAVGEVGEMGCACVTQGKEEGSDKSHEPQHKTPSLSCKIKSYLLTISSLTFLFCSASHHPSQA